MNTKQIKDKIRCKCCRSLAKKFDFCDFNKSCEELKGNFLAAKNVEVWYYKCPDCDFIFTPVFDHWDKDTFKKEIYNESYLEVDPDYASIRPEGNANLVSNSFTKFKDVISVLDYGGGNGLLEKSLQNNQFTKVATYDPFYPDHAKKPTQRFNLVTSFEVIEHVPEPLDTFKEIFSLVHKKEGLLLFSTLLQPTDIDKTKTNWWYIAPRNGHISIHSRKSLTLALAKFGFTLASFNSNLHIAYKTIPKFAEHLFSK